MAVPDAARLTVVEEPPTEGTVSGAPLSPIKFTANEIGAELVFVK